MNLNGPLVLHGLVLEGVVLSPAGQVPPVVVDGRHVAEGALGHAVVGHLESKQKVV